MPLLVGWGLTGSVGSELGHIWVRSGSNVGHVVCLGHVKGSIVQVGEMGHVGHWASESM